LGIEARSKLGDEAMGGKRPTLLGLFGTKKKDTRKGEETRGNREQDKGKGVKKKNRAKPQVHVCKEGGKGQDLVTRTE